MTTSGSSVALPLAGIRVLDFSQLILGPNATMTLGDFGADVIKVERPVSGDLSRNTIPFRDPAGRNHPVFSCLNRNKRSIALDLKNPQAAELIIEIVKETDVLVHNFRPGVMEQMGLGYDDLAPINPRLVYAFGCGFGLTGPYTEKAGQDTVIQAMTGLMGRRGDEAIPLAGIPATPVSDFAASAHLIEGILLALLQRATTGKGQVVRASLYDSTLAIQAVEAGMWLMRQKEFNFAALPFRDVFDTADGQIAIVAGWSKNAAVQVAHILEAPELLEDPRFANWELQFKNRRELHRLLKSKVRQKPSAYWLSRLEEHDILCAPVRTLSEALADEQTEINNMIWRKDTSSDHIAMVGSAIHMSDAQAAMHRAPPKVGEHGLEILQELGLSDNRIEHLVACGALSLAETETEKIAVS